jgi:hypothetical protein
MLHRDCAFGPELKKFLKSCKKPLLLAKKAQFTRRNGSGLAANCGMESAIISRRVLIAFWFTGWLAQQPLHKFTSLILGDSHGKNGRRGLEDGERQRSQIR